MLRTCLCTILLALSACGGASDLPLIGGGGGSSEDDGNPADVRLQATPHNIDSGDFVYVTIRIQDVKEPFVLKVRHNSNLAYVNGSMSLQGDGNPGPNTPSPTGFSVQPENSDDDADEDSEEEQEDEEEENLKRYLVVPFYSVAHFGEHGRGTLTFRFQGLRGHDDYLEIDADEFLEYTGTSVPFDPNNPHFSILDEIRIKVSQDR